MAAVGRAARAASTQMEEAVREVAALMAAVRPALGRVAAVRVAPANEAEVMGLEQMVV